MKFFASTLLVLRYSSFLLQSTALLLDMPAAANVSRPSWAAVRGLKGREHVIGNWYNQKLKIQTLERISKVFCQCQLSFRPKKEI